MALDRQTIEKKDFPVGSRGYDPEAVDAHLAALAEEIEEFKRSSRRRADTLASSASDQVRAIIQAAESSAADIQRDAETQAGEIREDADNEARAIREQASEYVGRVSESTTGMLQRIDAMDGELSALIDALRTGGNRLDSDLRLLQDNLRDVGASIVEHPNEFEADAPASTQPPTDGWGASADEPEPAEPVADGWGAPADGPVADDDLYDPDAPHASDPLAENRGGFTEPAAGATASSGSEDAEGARLIALNMALNGTPRDETARYLSENFQLADSDELLDEVYASVEG